MRGNPPAGNPNADARPSALRAPRDRPSAPAPPGPTLGYPWADRESAIVTHFNDQLTALPANGRRACKVRRISFFCVLLGGFRQAPKQEHIVAALHRVCHQLLVGGQKKSLARTAAHCGDAPFAGFALASGSG